MFALPESAMPPIADVLLHGGETTLWANNGLMQRSMISEVQAERLPTRGGLSEIRLFV